MTYYKVGDTVRKGYYVNRDSFELLTVERDGAVLSGKADGRYLRVPWVALLILAPVLGATFVFFLPAVGFVMVGYYIALGLYRLAARGVSSVAALAVSGFAPGEATLTRRWKSSDKPGDDVAQTPPEPADRLAELEKDIAERRNGNGKGQKE